MMRIAQAPIQFTKQPYIEDVGPRKIESIQFSTFGESEILKAAEVQVYRGVYYDSAKKPWENGLLDPHMGPANKNGICETCHGNFRECPGHYGYLTLALPVYNVGYLITVLDILKCICKVDAYSSTYMFVHSIYFDLQISLSLSLSLSLFWIQVDAKYTSYLLLVHHFVRRTDLNNYRSARMTFFCLKKKILLPICLLFATCVLMCPKKKIPFSLHSEHAKRCCF
nr:DNA-directed RNA polymerase III subunit RPC1-like [Coffea arabica]